ncbi:type II toxin-antitoxin system HicB family antitoxin [Candidatus Pyrohabitans sp.]
MQFSAVVTKGEKYYVSHCPELDIASQGKTIEEALENLKEAIELYLEDGDAIVPEPKTKPLVTMIEVKSGETSGLVRA